MDPKVSADTRLSYVTTGVLLEKLVAEKNMNKFTHVIIDEVMSKKLYVHFRTCLYISIITFECNLIFIRKLNITKSCNESFLPQRISSAQTVLMDKL